VDFLHKDLGNLKRGEVVGVTLSGNAANVLLLNSSNFSNYRNGRRWSGHGGHTTRSPVPLGVPSSGHWHLVVDLGGYPGRIGASVRVLPGALPPIRQSASNLGVIADIAQASAPPDPNVPESKSNDVFVSHATEDKKSFVRALVEELRVQDLSVWYDESELRVGDSLRAKIDEGLATCRFGLVVLSHAFFAKNWSKYELDGLVTREMTGEQIILPVWHEISKEEVIKHSPALANKVALRTSDYTAAEIAAEIAAVAGPTGE